VLSNDRCWRETLIRKRQRPVKITAALWCTLCLCVASVGAATPDISISDWSHDLGLDKLEGPSYTAGWLDMDQDGHDEPIWVSHEAVWYVDRDDAGSFVLKQATIAALTDPPLYERPEGQPALATGDFDRDGKTDLLVVEKIGRMYRVESPGHLVEMYTSIPWPPLGPLTIDVAVGDLNADGWPDIVLAQAGTSPEHFYQLGGVDLIYMNRGGHFERMPLEPALVKQTGSIALSDIDRDGRVDVIESVTFSQASHFSRILLNRTPAGALEPTFEVAEHTYDRGAMGMGVGIEDINQDGHLDFVHASTGNDFLALANGDGTYVDATWTSKMDHEWATDGGPRVQWAPSIIDMNADGLLDIYERHGHPEANSSLFDFTPISQPNLVYAQREDGTFERMPVPFVGNPEHNGRDSAFGDVDGDGLPDVAMGGMFTEFGGFSLGVPVLWHNDTTIGATSRVHSVRLRPTVSANPPAGTRVVGHCGDRTWTRTLTTGGHVGAVASADLYFAWTDCSTEASFDIHWPSGAVSKAYGQAGATAVLAEEPNWVHLGAGGEESLTLTVDAANTGAASVCYQAVLEADWDCCTAADGPCSHIYTPAPGAIGRVRLGADGRIHALQPLAGWYTLRTKPALPAPNKDVTLELFHGGIEASFLVADAWMRLEDKKVVTTLDAKRRVQVAVVAGQPAGEVSDISLFQGVTEINQWSIPTGRAVDPRWLDYAVYPNRNAASGRAWRLFLTPKPHNPSTELVEMDGLEIRTHPGNAKLKALVTRDHTGRISADVEWSYLQEIKQVALYEDGVFVAGPFPVDHLPDNAAIEQRLHEARGFLTRTTAVEDGDITRLIVTFYDKDGHAMPPATDLLDVELDGLVMTDNWETTNLFGGGWESWIVLRTLPGTGPASVMLRVKNGKKLGQWDMYRRARKDASLSLEHTTVVLSKSTLPVGVGADATIQVMARTDWGELLGRDVQVRVEGPPGLVIGPCVVNEAGISEATIEPGYYGGVFDVSVYIDELLVEVLPIEVVGPKPPAISDAPVDWTMAEDTMQDKPDILPTPQPVTSTGCNATPHRGSHPWTVFFIGVFWMIWNRRRNACGA
jgi:hypothetical protein